MEMVLCLRMSGIILVVVVVVGVVLASEVVLVLVVVVLSVVFGANKNTSVGLTPLADSSVVSLSGTTIVLDSSAVFSPAGDCRVSNFSPWFLTFLVLHTSITSAWSVR